MIRWRGRERSNPPGRAEPQHLGGDGDLHGAGGDELISRTGQQPLDRLLPAGEDDVEVVALGNPGAVDGVAGTLSRSTIVTRWKCRDSACAVSKAGHAGPQHDGVVVDGGEGCDAMPTRMRTPAPAASCG